MSTQDQSSGASGSLLSSLRQRLEAKQALSTSAMQQASNTAAGQHDQDAVQEQTGEEAEEYAEGASCSCGGAGIAICIKTGSKLGIYSVQMMEDATASWLQHMMTCSLWTWYHLTIARR